MKILVVDDQMAVALMMVFLFTRAGCEAEAATNAEKALRLAQTEVFDLITLAVANFSHDRADKILRNDFAA